MHLATSLRPRLALVSAFALSLLVALVLARGAAAQTWNETGDAGDLPASAQVTAGTGPLTTLNGNLASPDDVDMYCIDVTDPASFLARLTCVIIQGPNLWIFNSAGVGVGANSLCQASAKSINGALVTLPGTYYLAVSFDGVNPFAGANSIWLPANLAQRAPDGPGAAGAVSSWAGAANVGPINPYQVLLTGATFCAAPTPAVPATWGRIKQIYRD